MTYNIYPSSPDEVDSELKDFAKELFKVGQQISVDLPFVLDATKPNQIKIIRALEDHLDLEDLSTRYPHLKFKFGDGWLKNKGNKYEFEVFQDLKLYASQGPSAAFTHPDTINPLRHALLGSLPPFKVLHEGPTVVTRSLVVNGAQPVVVNPTDHIGEQISDVTLDTGFQKHYLSIKNSTNFSYIGTGVAKLFSEDQFTQDRAFSKPEIIVLLSMFGMKDVHMTRFRKTFQSYGKDNVNGGPMDVVIKDFDKTIIDNFLKSIIGYGYWVIHKIEDKTKVYYVDEALQSIICDTKSITLKFPSLGVSKMFTVIIETALRNFTVELRDKDSKNGIYRPTHLFVKYKYKSL